MHKVFHFFFYLFGRVHKPLKPFGFTKLCLFIYNCLACLCVFIGFALTVDAAFFSSLPLMRWALRVITFSHYTWSAGVCFCFFLLSWGRYFDSNNVKALPKSTKKENCTEVTYTASSVVFCIYSSVYMFVSDFAKSNDSFDHCFYASSAATTQSNSNITVNGTTQHWNKKLQCYMAVNNILNLFHILPTLLVS